MRYVVRQGDNLGLIAKNHGVAITDIKRWNNLRNNNLKIGQVLKLQNAAPVTAKTVPLQTAGRATPSTTKPSAKTPKMFTYTVRQGDSLYLIARRQKVDLKQLQRWNPKASKNLKIGQSLVIYSDK